MHIRKWSFPALLAGFVIAAGAVLASSSADAQNAKKGPTGGSSSANIITGSSFDAMIAALEDNGFSVDMTTDNDGDPEIESTDDDDPFTIHFYGCTDGMDCEYLQFVEGWDLKNGVDSDVIEMWNENRVWGRAFIDSDNDPWIDLAMNLKGGVTAENFSDTVGWWWAVIRDFEDEIGFNKK